MIQHSILMLKYSFKHDIAPAIKSPLNVTILTAGLEAAAACPVPSQICLGSGDETTP